MKLRSSNPDCVFMSRAGVTLAEYLVAIAIGALVLAATLSFSLYSSRSMAGVANYAALNSQSTRALDQLTRDIRQAVGVAGFQNNQLILNDGSNRPPIRFIYSSTARSL